MHITPQSSSNHPHTGRSLFEQGLKHVEPCRAKLALFDIDGTLRNKHGVVSVGVREALTSLRDSGCAIGFASGRPLFSAFPMLSDLGINSLSILMAGGVVARPDGSVLWSSGMESSEATALVEGARRLKLDLELITTTDYFTERESDLLAIHASYHPKRSQHVEDLLKIAASEPVIKASIIIDPSAGLEGLEELRRALPELNFTVAHGAAHPDLYFVNVNSAETSPLKALEVLLREQNLRAADVISFGDGESDIPLLSTVGTSVAMENANEKVKRSAQWVTKSVEEDGVAAAIRELFNL